MNNSRDQIIQYFKDAEKIFGSVDPNQISKLVEIDLGDGSLTRANPVEAISLCDNMSIISI